ncbi:titin-like [Belonocnema kinseyi]|nr:titin-like [Belonocnema kinseyi]
MAMLAEPRRKQKWTLNPRGKHWSEDSNKFGQKMLEKMGWTSGKGLGAKEQGMTEHVRVKFKDDSAGIGYSKDEQDKEWTHHQEGFNDLLMNLQKSQNMEPTELMESKEIALSGMSLEQKSKQSKARVHYQKFTRGKDVNKYSAKDLANIFGKKTLDEKPKVEEKVEEEFDAEPIGAKDNTGGVVTIKGGNIHDYFRNKMSTMKRNEDKEFKENSDSEEERYVGFGFSTAKCPQESNFSQSVEDSTNCAFKNPCLDIKALSILKASSVAKPSPIPKPPRKRKNGSAFSNEGLDLNYPEKNDTPKKMKVDFEVREPDCFVNPALNLDFPVDETCNGAEFEVARPSGLLNPALDLSEETPKKKRKKEKNGTPKKVKTDVEVKAPDCFINPALNLEFPVDETRNGAEFEVARPSGLLDLSEDTPKKKRKKEKNGTPKKVKTYVEVKAPDCFINPALNLECPVDETRNGAEFEVSRPSVLDPNLNLSEDTPKKKDKKRKKVVPSTEGFVNSALDLNCPVNERDSGARFEVPRVEMGLANDALDLSDEASGKRRVTFNNLVEYNMDGVKKKKGKTKLDRFEVENEKLKRKKKQAPEEKGMVFVNEALEVDAISEEIQDNELNERKCRKEKRKKNRRMSNLETIEEAPEEEKESDEIIRELEVITVNEVSIESEEILEATPKKSKKKKKKDINQEELDVIEICESDKDTSLTDTAKTIEVKKKKKKEKKANEADDKANGFDKENLYTKVESLPETEKRKKKKKRKSMETCQFFLDENIDKKEEPEIEECLEVVRENKKKKKRPRDSDLIMENENSEAKKVENCEDHSTPSKKRRFTEETSEIPQSPYEKMAKKSKNVLKAMFAKSPVVHFKGSNINEIKGYGVDP